MQGERSGSNECPVLCVADPLPNMIRSADRGLVTALYPPANLVCFISPRTNGTLFNVQAEEERVIRLRPIRAQQVSLTIAFGCSTRPNTPPMTYLSLPKQRVLGEAHGPFDTSLRYPDHHLLVT